LQATFEAYEEADMPALERDVQALPQWRDQSQQLREHLAVMQNAFQESQSRLEGRLRELGDELARQTEETQARIDELGETREELRDQQWRQESELEQRYQQQRQELDESYRERLESGVERLAELKAQLAASAASAEEIQEAELAQARLDQAQTDREAASETLGALREELDTLKRARDQSE
ncbi:ATP-binding protein, partial [Parasedimentitalea maritima]